MSWGVYKWKQTHVIPHDDDADHVEHECPCHPVLEDTMVIHNSYDGREAFERGERKAS